MQYADGRSWRDHVTKDFEPMGIHIFNPYLKPFVNDIEEDANEDEATRKTYKELLAAGEYTRVQEKFEKIRAYDLSLVHRSDFIVGHLIPHIASWGTANELCEALACKKPMFLSIEGGKKCTPLWLLGMFPHECFYDSIEDVIATIKGIDAGTEPVSHDLWKLLAL
jgi:hypothetical protein